MLCLPDALHPSCDGGAHAFIPLEIEDHSDREAEQCLATLRLPRAQNDNHRAKRGSESRLRCMA